MTSSPGRYYLSRYIQKLILVLSLCAFFFLVLYPAPGSRQSHRLSLSKPSTVELNTAKENLYSESVVGMASGPPRKKKILAWTKLFGKDFFLYYKRSVETSEVAFSKCPVHKNCEWTIDRSEVSTADAVVFHIFPKDFVLEDLPLYRTVDQQWVFMNLEPPQRFQDGMMLNLDGMFNLTATYEDDADISVPYGYYYKREKPLVNYIPNFTNRTKPIVWMVSRCHTLSRREVYAKDLQAHIEVDIFGACGKPAPKKGVPPINLDFRTELAKEYYFYLAFENTDCQDYITEKFWSALLAGLVPIVRGQFPHYERHAPPGSYINADSFFSVQDLADYLRYLIKHPQQYNKYFEWRRDYHVATVATYINLDIHCGLCALLHEQTTLHKTYNMSQRYSTRRRCFDYHYNLGIIENEAKIAYNDEFKDFLPIKT